MKDFTSAIEVLAEAKPEVSRSPFAAGFWPRESHSYCLPKVNVEDPISRLAVQMETGEHNELFLWLCDLLNIDGTFTDLDACIRDARNLHKLLDRVYPQFSPFGPLPELGEPRPITIPTFFNACAQLNLVTEKTFDAARDSSSLRKSLIQVLLQMQRHWQLNEFQKVKHDHSDSVSGLGVAPSKIESDMPLENIGSSPSLLTQDDEEPDVSRNAAPSIIHHKSAVVESPRSISRVNSITTYARDSHVPMHVSPHQRQQSSGDEIQPESSRETLVLDGRSFLLGNVVGRGQFGTVFRAIDANKGTTFAIKRIPLEGQSIKEVDIMLHEVDLLRQLSSQHIVRYEGFQRSATHLSIITEYVENGSLLRSLKTFGHFSEKLTSVYTKEILAGLEYLHSKDVVHCDIKCANVLTTKSGTAKLSDFGISLRLSGVTTLKTGVAAGTPYWIAPEVILLRGTSKASDIWALACTIVEMLTGKPPYSHQNTMSAMYSIVEDKCPPIPTTESSQIREFLEACFQKEPRLRPSASELRLHSWFLPAQIDSSSSYEPNEKVQLHKSFSTELTAKAKLRSSQSETLGDNLLRRLHKEASVSFVPPQLEYLPSFVSTRAEMPEVRTKFMRPSVHHLIKVGLKEGATCTICRNAVRKALYCNDCQSVVHPRCLVNNPIPCQFGNITSHSIVPFERFKTSQPIHDQDIIPTLQFRQIVSKAKRGAREFKTKMITHRDNSRKTRREIKLDHCVFM